MSRFLILGKIKRAAHNTLSTGSSYSASFGDGPGVVSKPYVSAFRSFHGNFGTKTSYRRVETTFKRDFSKSYSNMCASNIMTRHAQSVCRRLYQKYSCSAPTFPHISKIAQAFSLASTRSNLIYPGVVAFIYKELFLSQKACADSEYLFPLRDTVYTTAEDGQIFLASIIFGVLELAILLLRAMYLAILFSPSIALAPFADSFGFKYRRLWLRIVHRTLEKAGPAFIKWGQWAATRPDLFPRDLCNELTKLQSEAPEHCFGYTKKTVENAFGRKLSDIFENFDEKPVASGSIAQVHRASLRFRYPGQKVKPIDVAVKVRHPGVGESIRRDFVIINAVAKISNLIPTLNWLRLDESVQQFGVFMMSQVDLSREAAHLSRFIYNFRRWKDVSFPKPLYPLVHPSVLVETYEQGESVSYYIDDDIQRNGRFRSTLAHIGTHALLKMLLVDNFIHADMHPGNILVRVAPKGMSSQTRLEKSKPHVIFIDVGMTAELSKTDRVNLIDFFRAVAKRDGQTAAECTLRLSKRQNCPNPWAFIKEVKESFDFWGTAEGDLVHPADCMQQLLEQVRRHKVNIDGNVCTVIVTTLVLEGWQRKLDPDYDIMKTLRNMLFKADWTESLSYTIEGLMAP